ncbi:MAG: 50S ribosomal protein L10 [Bacteroidota bacterium]|nr:50S ribosomal protein L10 [Bacteroidota bacterium]
MNKDQKQDIVEGLTQLFNDSGKNFYITDISALNVVKNNSLRRMCFEQGVSLQAVKNTLIRKALVNCEIDDSEFKTVLKGSSAIMISEKMTAPAKLIKEYRQSNGDKGLTLKAAYLQESLYIGDDQLDTLTQLKGKEELIGDVIALLQSPAKNVISALKGQGAKIAGILKTLEERNA